MSSLKSSVLAVLGAAVLTAGVLYLIERHRADEARQLRGANSQLRKDAYDRQRSAAQASLVSSDPPRVRTLAPVGQTAAAPANEEPDYRNEGQSTPVAALQTIAWACDRGDSETMAKLITFEPGARPKAEAYLAAMPPEVRTQWPTIEALAATMLVGEGMHRPYPRARLLARATVEPVADDLVRLRLPGTPKDGRLYQKSGDNWKQVITEASVDAYLARMQAAAAQQ